MNKFFAAAAIGLLSISAHAQSNPPGAAVPPHTPGVATGKAEMAAEAKKDMRTQGQVRTAGGDTMASAEGAGPRLNRAAAAPVEKAVQKREQRRPNATAAGQGGTPK